MDVKSPNWDVKNSSDIRGGGGGLCQYFVPLRIKVVLGGNGGEK